MASRLLGCSRLTSSEALLGELGWWPMKARRDMLMLRFWAKICRMKDNRLVKRIYKWRKLNMIDDNMIDDYHCC